MGAMISGVFCRPGCGFQPDVGSLPLVKYFSGIRDVRFNPIRFAQGLAEEPDLRANTPLRGHRPREVFDRQVFY